jgi:hypothetical protein
VLPSRNVRDLSAWSRLFATVLMFLLYIRIIHSDTGVRANCCNQAFSQACAVCSLFFGVNERY